MATKYYCSKCGKKFVEWGAEKLGFLCPECPGAELKKAGFEPETPKKAPTLKRKTKTTPVVAAPEPEENDVTISDQENLDVEGDPLANDDQDEGADDELVIADKNKDEDTEDVAKDLNFESNSGVVLSEFMEEE